MRIAPFVRAAFVERVLDPEHATARTTHHRGEPVHVGHDVARHGTDRVTDLIVHECILQIDHDQRRPPRIEIGMRMGHATSRDDALCDGIGNVEPVHPHHASASTPSDASSPMMLRRRASSSSTAICCSRSRNSGEAENPLIVRRSRALARQPHRGIAWQLDEQLAVGRIGTLRVRDQLLHAGQLANQVIDPVDVLNLHVARLEALRQFPPAQAGLARAPWDRPRPRPGCPDASSAGGQHHAAARPASPRAPGRRLRTNSIQARRIAADNAAICAASPPASIGASDQAAKVPNTNGRSMQ